MFPTQMNTPNTMILRKIKNFDVPLSIKNMISPHKKRVFSNQKNISKGAILIVFGRFNRDGLVKSIQNSRIALILFYSNVSTYAYHSIMYYFRLRSHSSRITLATLYSVQLYNCLTFVKNNQFVFLFHSDDRNHDTRYKSKIKSSSSTQIL